MLEEARPLEARPPEDRRHYNGVVDITTRLTRLATLNAIGEVLNREADFSSAVRPTLVRLIELVDLTAGWVFQTNVSKGDSHQGSFSLAAYSGLPPALMRDDLEPLCKGGCECQSMLKGGELECGVNMVTCSRLASAIGDKGGLEIHASVPLLGQSGPVGILNLTAPGDTRFDAETLSFLNVVGKQIGIAFERSRLQEERTEEARYAAVLEERQRIAQEMHDQVAQLLFAADLSLEVARSQGDDETRERSLSNASESVKSALLELRALVEVLRPAELSGGLHPALTRLADRTSGSVGVHLDAEELDLSPSHSDALYRIAQEALHNALRHARAQNIWLRLRRTRGRLELRVEDDGRGLPVGLKSVGLGIDRMRAHAENIGGSFQIRTRDAGGALVLIEVPWPSS